MSSYSDNPNKSYIRKTIDLDIIKTFSEQKFKGEGLYYFGLPSRNIADIRDWKDYISKIDAVEIDKDDYFKMCQLLTAYGFSGYRHCCNIQDLILKSPEKIKGYNLVNLDFLGHFITHYRLSKRLDSINKLIEIQKSRRIDNFLLLLTFKTARGIGSGKINEFLTDCENCVHRVGNNAREIFDWARRTETRQYEKLFILVPILIIYYGGNYSYDTKCREIVFYYGKSRSSPMVHFIFEFIFTGKSIPIINADKFKPIPLKKVKEVEHNSWFLHQSDMPEFKEDIKCLNCGELIPYKSKYCLNCGNKVSE